MHNLKSKSGPFVTEKKNLVKSWLCTFMNQKVSAAVPNFGRGFRETTDRPELSHYKFASKGRERMEIVVSPSCLRCAAAAGQRSHQRWLDKMIYKM